MWRCSAPGASARSTRPIVARQPGVRLNYVVDVIARGRARSPQQHGAQVADVDGAIGDAAIGAVVIVFVAPTRTPTSSCARPRQARRSSARSRSISTLERARACADAVQARGRRVHDRLPAALRSDVRGAEGAPRRGRDRRAGDAGRDEPRSRRAAGRLHQALGRHLQGHADPRLRHLPLDPRRRSGHAVRHRQLPDRSGDRGGRRHRFHRGDDPHEAAAAWRRSTRAAARRTATTSASRCSAATGMLQAGNHRPTEVTAYSTTARVSSDMPEHFFLERYRAAYALEIAHFFEAVAQGQAGAHDDRRTA